MTAGVRVAINGFGRIGRSVLRAVLARAGEGATAVDIVGINDVNDPEMLAYLLEFDTVQHQLAHAVKLVDRRLEVGCVDAVVSAERDPTRLAWAVLDVDVVIESTGHFTMADEAARHLGAGARRVIISAPATGADLTICMGVNHHRYDPARHRVLSNASCTTNCLAVMADVLHSRFGIVSGFMSTVHAYTNDQNLLDLPHRGHTRDLRRSRAAAQNIVPSSTGAARAIGQVLPELEGRLDGMAFRVPVSCGSITDLVCTLERSAGRDEVNGVFEMAASTPPLRGVLSVTDIPLVSSDIVGRAESCVFSACDTMARDRQVKVLGWYDNEWAYANRLLDLAELVGTSP
jgi:glyceraldehyde 3-phosphate dehydrogenase